MVPYSVYDYYSMQNMANAADEASAEDDHDLSQYEDDTAAESTE